MRCAAGTIADLRCSYRGRGEFLAESLNVTAECYLTPQLDEILLQDINACQRRCGLLWCVEERSKEKEASEPWLQIRSKYGAQQKQIVTCSGVALRVAAPTQLCIRRHFLHSCCGKNRTSGHASCRWYGSLGWLWRYMRIAASLWLYMRPFPFPHRAAEPTFCTSVRRASSAARTLPCVSAMSCERVA